jgi:putative ATP-binding cassette transporter
LILDKIRDALRRRKVVASGADATDGFRRLRVDARNYRIGPLLFSRIWKLAKPYWTRPDAWKSWLVYAFLVISAPAFVVLFAINTDLTAKLTNAIVAKNQALTWSMLAALGAFSFAQAAFYLVQNFVDSRLQLHWRRWLTRYLVDRYLAKRTYYDISLMEDLDNPDQRIQEEIGPFVQMVASFPRTILQNFGLMFMGGFIIANITPSLFWFVLIYAILQTVSTFFVYLPTIKQQFEITVAEADLRYGILHVRDNAETVAFYRGEYAEKAQIEARLSTAVKKQTVLINYAMIIALVNGVFTLVWAVVPYMLLAPIFFAGRIEFGAIAQAMAAGGSMIMAMSTLSNSVPQVSAAAPKAVRLAEILERFDAMEAARDVGGASRFQIEHAPEISMRGVSLETPGGEQALAREISFQVAPREHMVIIGQTGVGKSSVLRAMAGLWTRGSGTLTMPLPEQCLFLPQRPYMILADLRSQLLYPHGDANLTDSEIEAALVQARLPNLMAQHGGLYAARDWGRVLSLGEQQRVAFARVLLSKPKFVFLDEATSAVDRETEAALYDMLKAAGVTYVSVGHRETILRHHDWALQLFPGGGWKLSPIREVMPAEAGEAADQERRVRAAP